jgi:hypothetical protein
MQLCVHDTWKPGADCILFNHLLLSVNRDYVFTDWGILQQLLTATTVMHIQVNPTPRMFNLHTLEHRFPKVMMSGM